MSKCDELRAAIDEKMAANPRLTRAAAAAAVVREQPELQEAAIAEANQPPRR